MNFSWAINELFKDLNHLEQLYLNETDPYKKSLLNYYYSSLKEVLIHEQLPKKDVKNKRALEDNVRYSTYQMPFLSSYIDLIRDFHDYLDEIIFSLGIRNTNKIIVSNEDALLMTNGFYKNKTNDYIYQIFNKFYQDHDHCIHFTKGSNRVSGEILYIGGLDKAYISILENEAINKISSLIHEYGHGIAYSQNNLKCYLGEQLFTEIGSIFMELIGDNYLDDFFDQRIVAHNSYQRIINYYKMADDILTINSFISLYERHSYPKWDDFQKIVNKEYPSLEINCNEIFNNSFDLDILFRYVLCYMIAIELYEIYKIDKDKALDIYSNMMKLDNKPSEFYRITQMVKPMEHVNVYTKKIIDKL